MWVARDHLEALVPKQFKHKIKEPTRVVCSSSGGAPCPSALTRHSHVWTWVYSPSRSPSDAAWFSYLAASLHHEDGSVSLLLMWSSVCASAVSHKSRAACRVQIRNPQIISSLCFNPVMPNVWCMDFCEFLRLRSFGAYRKIKKKCLGWKRDIEAKIWNTYCLQYFGNQVKVSVQNWYVVL